MPRNARIHPLLLACLRLVSLVNKALAWPLRGLVWLYRRAVSPFLPAACRFYPSCSAYADEALATHGFARGTALAAWRVCRCHPWSAGGVDLVPSTGQTGKSSRAARPSLRVPHSTGIVADADV